MSEEKKASVEAASKTVPAPEKELSPAEKLQALELQIKEAELEEIHLRRQEREYSVKDLKARLAERDVVELQKKEDRAAQGRTFTQQRLADEQKWAICTHKKGGKVSPRDMTALHTGGNANQYAVIKHQMINGDMWVRCLRCGRTWAPPLKEKFYFDARGKQVPPQLGVFDKERFLQAIREYDTATKFETNNSPSGSVQVRFWKFNEAGEQVDAAQDYRTLVKDTNLR